MKEERGKNKMESRKWKVGSLILVVAFLLSACSTGEGIEAHEAWARTALQGENSAVYLILHNHTEIVDVLINVSSDVASAVELHLSEVTSDVMRMSPLESIEILADDEVQFQSGNYHIMLIGLKKDLNAGDEITITLYFQKYPNIVLNVPVKNSGDEHQSHP